MFCYLPGAVGMPFLQYIPKTLPAVLEGLADDVEGVREQAMEAAQAAIARYGTEESALDSLLPSLENGLFSENWRIRQASVTLLGELLEQIAAHASMSERMSQLEQGKVSACGEVVPCFCILENSPIQYFFFHL